MPNKITPMLWFNNQAEEAMRFYLSLFKDSKELGVSRYNEAAQEAGLGAVPGSVMTADFELFGQAFTALNGGPEFNFSEAISFVVHCDSQDEVDYYWDKLLQGGEPSQCGWLKDKFGVSWQVVPDELFEMMNDRDPAKAKRVTEAMLKMVKLDLNELRRARDAA